MTTPPAPQPQSAPLPARVQAILAAEFFDKPAPVDRCGECSFDQTTTILQRYTNGTARWVSFCPSCYSRADLGSADVSDRLAARTLLAETAAALAAAEAREAGLRAALDAAIQCEQDVVDAYERGAPMVVLDEAVADLKRDSLPHLKRARAALGGTQ